MLKSYEYSGSDPNGWNSLRYWRFYDAPGVNWWLRLDLDRSVSAIDNIVKSNKTGGWNSDSLAESPPSWPKLKPCTNKGPSVKYDHFMRTSMDKNKENEKYFTLKISIVALIRYV